MSQHRPGCGVFASWSSGPMSKRRCCGWLLACMGFALAHGDHAWLFATPGCRHTDTTRHSPFSRLTSGLGEGSPADRWTVRLWTVVEFSLNHGIGSTHVAHAPQLTHSHYNALGGAWRTELIRERHSRASCPLRPHRFHLALWRIGRQCSLRDTQSSRRAITTDDCNCD